MSLTTLRGFDFAFDYYLPTLELLINPTPLASALTLTYFYKAVLSSRKSLKGDLVSQFTGSRATWLNHHAVEVVDESQNAISTLMCYIAESVRSDRISL
ncbi:MAG TPA: hypothetical protein V6D43_16805 [Candidatus Sericytochromatia bacterium]